MEMATPHQIQSVLACVPAHEHAHAHARRCVRLRCLMANRLINVMAKFQVELGIGENQVNIPLEVKLILKYYNENDIKLHRFGSNV